MNRASEISRRPFENSVHLTSFYFDLPSSNRFSFSANACAENGKGSELELSEETVQGVLAACRQEIG